MLRCSVLSLLLCAAPGFGSAAAAADNVLVNGTFEPGLDGWNSVWARTGEARAEIDSAEPHGGRQAVRIVHTGARDWSFAQERRVPVKPGDIYEMRGWVRVEGEGRATLGVVLYGAENKVLDWSYGGRSTSATKGWHELCTRFVIPPDAAEVWPRLIGDGPSTVGFDDVTLVRSASLAELRGKELPETVQATSQHVEIVFRTQDATFSVTDRDRPTMDAAASAGAGGRQRARGVRRDRRGPPRSGQHDGDRRRHPARRRAARSCPGALGQRRTGPRRLLPGRVQHRSGRLADPAGQRRDQLPGRRRVARPMWYHLYGGHGLCMAWYGCTDGQQRPDDASSRRPTTRPCALPRATGGLCIAPEWLPQKRQFGPARRLRYVFFDDGGYVAMCKRYRQHAQADRPAQDARREAAGESRTSTSSSARSTSGAGTATRSRWCRELQAAGIERILWSNRGEPGTARGA